MRRLLSTFGLFVHARARAASESLDRRARRRHGPSTSGRAGAPSAFYARGPRPVRSRRGLLISKVLERLSFTRQTRILMLGLDAAGKTTVLYKLKLGDLVTTIPTIGFNVEQVRYKNLEMTIWDVGGQDKIRALWRHYYEHTDALVWIVDSADESRLEEARDELHKVLADDCLRGATVLVYANKQDMPCAMRSDQLVDALGMRSLRGHTWYVQPASAASGDGLFEGLDWLHNALRDRQKLTRAG
jgi:ADP-ribosylation factor protein 1